MNVFFAFTDSPPAYYLKEMAEELSRFVNIEHYIVLDAPRTTKEMITTAHAPDGARLTSLSYFDCEYGIYKNADWDEIEPLDDTLIKKMSPYEGEILDLMERQMPLDRYYYTHYRPSGEDGGKEIVFNEIDRKFRVNKYFEKHLSYSEKRRLYFRHLRYWNYFISKHSVELFLWGHTPHIGFEIVIYRLAQIWNLPSVMMGHAIYGKHDRVLYRDFKNSDLNVPENIRKLKQSGNLSGNLNLSDDYQREWMRVTSPATEQNVQPNVLETVHKQSKRREMQKKHWKTRIKKLFTGEIFQWLLSDKILDIDYWHYRIKGLNNTTRLGDKLFEFYESLCVPPDFKEKYIYFPLHLEPELTVAPLGGVFANQVLIAQMLSYVLPKDYYIYVKENPRQQYFCRTSLFYLDFLDVPRVRLISRKVNTFELLEHCVATATITGTAGWEGLFKGKPSFWFGDHVRQYATGMYKIRTLEDAKNAVKEIIHEGKKPSMEDLKIFIKAVDMAKIECDFGKMENGKFIVNRDNIKKVVAAFVKKYNEYLEINPVNTK